LAYQTHNKDIETKYQVEKQKFENFKNSHYVFPYKPTFPKQLKTFENANKRGEGSNLKFGFAMIKDLSLGLEKEEAYQLVEIPKCFFNKANRLQSSSDLIDIQEKWNIENPGYEIRICVGKKQLFNDLRFNF
jgi:hypothetical protein